MSSIHELHGPSDPVRPFWQGRVHSAPSDISDRMDVIVPDFEADLVWKGCRWMPRGDLVTLPNPGDVCLIVLDHLGEPWVIAWDPF